MTEEEVNTIEDSVNLTEESKTHVYKIDGKPISDFTKVSVVEADGSSQNYY